MVEQEVQRLETEKHDLIFDGQQRLEQAQIVQDELDKLRAKLDKVRREEVAELHIDGSRRSEGRRAG